MTTRPEFGSAGGVRLRELIKRYGALGPEAALAVLGDSLIGLAAALEHGAVHWDYQPENVLIDRHGGIELTGFGRPAVTDPRVPARLTPYQAPELRHGAPASWASNVYAATAVFFECLTGLAPSPERIRQSGWQQLAASGTAGQTVGQLRDLVAWGMADRPADRPASAGHLITELDGLAAACYGPEWYRRGRRELAGRVADVTARGNRAPGNAGRAPVNAGRGSRPGGHRGARPGHHRARRPGLVAGVAAVTVAVLGLAGTAFALSGHSGPGPSGSAPGTSQGASSSSAAGTVNLREPSGGKTAFTADATVTPAATTSTCATPATFTVAGTISATGAGTVTYRWIGSSGMTGQVQTLHFSGAGTQRVTGTTVRSKTAGTGWAAIKIVSPKAATSNKATYILGCSNAPVTVSATAAVTPARSTVKCGAAPPSATFTGTIHDAKAGTVTYYWELPTGNGPTRSLTFSAPGTEPTAPATVTAASDTSNETGTLVVLSPAAVSSNTATFSVSCTPPAPTGSSAPSTAPALTTQPIITVDLSTNQPTPKNVACGSTPPTFEQMAMVTSNETIPAETYHWVRPDGTTTAPQTMNLNAGDTSSTSDKFTPASDSLNGSETLVFTSPAQGSWSIPLVLTCGSGSPPAPSQSQTYLDIAPPGQYVNDIVTGYVGITISSFTLTPINGTGPYTWSATGLPPGLTINAATGTISGTPTAQGGFSPDVVVTDSESPPQSADLVFSFTISYFQVVILGQTPPDGTVGTAYPDVTYVAHGGNGIYTWSVTPGTELPAGLTFSPSGVLSGTPTVAGTFTISISVEDTSNAATGNSTVQLPLVINPAPLPPEDLGWPQAKSGSRLPVLPPSRAACSAMASPRPVLAGQSSGFSPAPRDASTIPRQRRRGSARTRSPAHLPARCRGPTKCPTPAPAWAAPVASGRPAVPSGRARRAARSPPRPAW